MRAFGHIHSCRGAVGAAAHAVVARPEGAAGDDGELRHLRARHGHDQLGAVPGDTARLVLLADHEARDVLEEDEGNPPLAREFDEMRALLRRLGEQDAVVREDSDRIALDPREAADERLPVQRLELVETAAVDESGDDLPRIDLMAEVLGDEAVQIGRVDGGLLRTRRRPRAGRAGGGRGCATISRQIASACSSEIA